MNLLIHSPIDFAFCLVFSSVMAVDKMADVPVSNELYLFCIDESNISVYTFLPWPILSLLYLPPTI